jgi:hypothetical protein
MENLHQNQSTSNRVRPRIRPSQPRRRPQIPHVKASISVASFGDGFGVATAIYQRGQSPKRDFILLKPGECLNAERAWLAAYSRVCVWLDQHDSDAQLFIIAADEREDRRRAA